MSRHCNGLQIESSFLILWVVVHAWPFLVVRVICLVNSDNERDLKVLTSHAIPEWWPEASGSLRQ